MYFLCDSLTHFPDHHLPPVMVSLSGIWLLFALGNSKQTVGFLEATYGVDSTITQLVYRN